MAKSLFESASPAAKVGLKRAKDSTETVAGLEMLASIKVVEATLEAVKELCEGSIKVSMHEHFVSIGSETHRRPENYKGEEGDATGSLQLRKRSTASKLDDNERELLSSYSVPFETVASTFQISPKYAGDETVMAKINKVLVKAGMPEDLFEVVPGKAVATDESIESVFRMNDTDTIAKLLPAVTTLAIRAQLKNNTTTMLKAAFKRVSDALNGDLEVESTKKAASVAASLPTFAKSKKAKV